MAAGTVVVTDLDGIVWLIGLALVGLIALGALVAFLALGLAVLRGAARARREPDPPADGPG